MKSCASRHRTLRRREAFTMKILYCVGDFSVHHAPKGVSLVYLEQVFRQFAHRRSNALSKHEIAQAALSMYGLGHHNTFMLLATFLVGGKARTGLFPNSHKDNFLHFSELQALAGKSKWITPESFKKYFPELAGEGNLILVEEIVKYI